MSERNTYKCRRRIWSDCPIVDIYYFDKGFITSEIDFRDADGDYDINKLEDKIGLLKPYRYYKNIVGVFDTDWLNCEIISYNRNEIILRYYSTNGKYEFDDK